MNRLTSRPTIVLWCACTVLFVLGAMGVGCGDRYVFNRPSYERGTLGEELFAIWREDAARARHNARAKVEMLGRRRGDFVESVDTIAPKDQLGDVDAFIQGILPLVDRRLLPSTTRKTRIVLREWADDRKLLEAMTSDGGLEVGSFHSPKLDPNWTDHWVTYDRLEPLADETSRFLLARDGVSSVPSDIEEQSRSLYDLQRLLVERLREAGGGDSGGEEATRPDETIVQELLLEEDDRFAPTGPAAGAEPLPVVRVDGRGHPRARTEGDGVVAPFRDDNDDGLADLDDQGRFRLRGDRRATHLEPFASTSNLEGVNRDDWGRARSGETPLFEYVDLRRTGFGFALRRFRDIHDQRLLWPMLDGLPAVLDETSAEDEWGDYRGHEPAPELSQLLDTGLDLLDTSLLPELSRGFADLLERHAGTVARLLEAVERFQSAVDARSDVQLSEDSTIGYDVMPLLAEVASDRQLWQDVLEAFRDPVTRNMDEAFETLLKYRDTDVVPPEGGAYDRCFRQCRAQFQSQGTDEHPNGIGLVERYECIRQCPTDELFSKKTKFDAPESKENRSLMQRLLHLLRDATGAPYTIGITDARIGLLANLPDVATLPGAGEAFVQSIAGNLKMKEFTTASYDDVSRVAELLGAGSFVEFLSRITELVGSRLDPEPTPSQITRLFNQRDLRIECGALEQVDFVSSGLLNLLNCTGSDLALDIRDPTCNDGYRYSRHHADMLYAAEASGLVDSIQPLAKAFSDHGRETLLLKFFIVVHEHYSSRDDLYFASDGTPSPMKGANFVSYEPVLYDAMKKGYLVEALHQAARSIGRTPDVGGEPFGEQLRQWVLHATEPGGAERQEDFELLDGDVVEEPSRLHVFVSRIAAMSDRLEAKSTAGDELETAVDALYEMFLATERTGNDRPRFATPGTIALARRGLGRFADEAERLRERDRLERKLSTTWPDAFESTIETRTFAHLVSLLDSLRTPDERHQLVEETLTHLLEARRGRDGLALFLYDLFVRAKRSDGVAPLAEATASILDPDRTWEVERYGDLPLTSHVALLARQIMERDEAGTGFEMLRRGLKRRNGLGRPLAVLGDVFAQYFRVDPRSTRSFTTEDYARAYRKLATWLADDTRGLEQFYDIVEQRRGASDGDDGRQGAALRP
jgi:hypothetical protein